MQKFFYERSPVWDYILMLVGTALIAVSIQCVYDPVSMVTGGFTGLAIIIKDVTGYLIPEGLLVLPLSYEILRKRFCREEFLCG